MSKAPLTLVPLPAAAHNAAPRPANADADTGTDAPLLATLKAELGPARFTRYFTGSTQIRLTDDGLDVLTPHAFTADFLRRRFGTALRNAASGVLGREDAPVHFRVTDITRPGDASTCSPKPAAAIAAQAHSLPAAPDRRPARKAASKARFRHSLDDFVVGESNVLAYSAVQGILNQEGPSVGVGACFLHGECGLGKTHLLQGAAAYYQQHTPGTRVVYTTGEAFTNAYIHAVRHNEIESFRCRFRMLDLLCIDDIHFLSNKEATQREFLHTFDALGLEGGRVLLASDEHPAHIASFCKELSSRFVSGMVARLSKPDQPLRARIIQRLAQRRGAPIDPDAASLLAAGKAGSVRQLEGALTTAHALHRLSSASATGAPIDASTVRRALHASGTPTATAARKPVPLQTILQTVTQELGIPMEELFGRSRRKLAVLARSMAAHTARTLTDHSYPEIAQAMGRSNHSTVLTACQRVRSQINEGAACDAGPQLSGVTFAELADRLSHASRRNATTA